jgi:hypothetical protein
LNETTVSGSYPAFRTSVRIVVILSIRRDGFPALSTHTTPRGQQAVAGTEKSAALQTAPSMLDGVEPSLRTMPKNQTTERIHGSDARYLLHRLLPSVRRRVQASPSV